MSVETKDINKISDTSRLKAVDGIAERETTVLNTKGPQLTIGDFSGPLDLLYHLIEKNKVDIYDIPIAFVTEQYMSYMDELDGLDMDLASDFLLMASSLLQIKSAMLLPLLRPSEETEEADPRDELVLRLLAYRRARLLASEIAKRQEEWSGVYFHLPETAKSMGIKINYDELAKPLRFEDILRGSRAVSERNTARYQDVASKMTKILQREKVSLREKLASIWQSLRQKGRLFFTELFPYGASRAEKVTGFLAVLELLKSNRIFARQESATDIIELEYNPETEGDEAGVALLVFVREGKMEEEYD